MASYGHKIFIVAQKYAQEKSRKWLFTTAKGDFGPLTNKCNQFVHDVIVEAGVTPPAVSKLLWFGSRMPTANEWSDPDVVIKNWVVVTEPALGDVVAIGFGDQQREGATGHVGIYGGNTTTISASSKVAGRVIQNEWGFRSDEPRPTFRRCVLEAPDPQGAPGSRKKAAQTA